MPKGCDGAEVCIPGVHSKIPILTLLHSERPKLYESLACSSSIGLRPPFGLPKSGLISEVVLILNTIS